MIYTLSRHKNLSLCYFNHSTHSSTRGIIGVLRIPSLYEYAIQLEYSDKQ